FVWKRRGQNEGAGAGPSDGASPVQSVFLRINKDRSGVVLYSELQQGLSSGT
uniref:Uncharacterized protein n=1 Tax=Chelonoidis abingdonii TaxID=106734 RepID=A0A8C0JFJ3_CHEAB